MTDRDESIDAARDRLMRDLWENSLRIILKQLRTATAGELSRLSGIEIPLVLELGAALCASGEFIPERISGESGEGDEEGYRFNPAHKLVLGIALLEERRVSVAVSDLRGDYVEQVTLTAVPGELSFFEDLVRRYTAQYPAISRLAFAVAGSGPGLFSAPISDLSWARFQDHCMEQYRLPVILETGIRAAALGHYITGNFGEERCVVGIHLKEIGDPPGGICVDGRIYRGRDNAAGEAIALALPGRELFVNAPVPAPGLIASLAAPMILLLNPDRLVIYGNLLPSTFGEEIRFHIRREIQEVIPGELLPEIVFISDILPDLLEGLLHLALKDLEPAVDFAG